MKPLKQQIYFLDNTLLLIYGFTSIADYETVITIEKLEKIKDFLENLNSALKELTQVYPVKKFSLHKTDYKIKTLSQAFNILVMCLEISEVPHTVWTEKHSGKTIKYMRLIQKNSHLYKYIDLKMAEIRTNEERSKCMQVEPEEHSDCGEIREKHSIVIPVIPLIHQQVDGRFIISYNFENFIGKMVSLRMTFSDDIPKSGIEYNTTYDKLCEKEVRYCVPPNGIVNMRTIHSERYFNIFIPSFTATDKSQITLEFTKTYFNGFITPPTQNTNKVDIPNDTDYMEIGTYGLLYYHGEQPQGKSLLAMLNGKCQKPVNVVGENHTDIIKASEISSNGDLLNTRIQYVYDIPLIFDTITNFSIAGLDGKCDVILEHHMRPVFDETRIVKFTLLKTGDKYSLPKLSYLNHLISVSFTTMKLYITGVNNSENIRKLAMITINYDGFYWNRDERYALLRYDKFNTFNLLTNPINTLLEYGKTPRQSEN